MVVCVCEVYSSIQGESLEAGWPCVLIRLAGCPFRCTYCDTPQAWEAGEEVDIPSLVARVAGFGIPLVEVTGGEPLAQEGSRPLIEALLANGHRVLVETGGAVTIAGVDPRARIILDVKAPGSGMADRQDWENLERLRQGDEIKIVLTDRSDYDWANRLLEKTGLAQRFTVHYAPATGELSPRILAEWILEDRLPVRLNVQLHAFIWGAGTRGV